LRNGRLARRAVWVKHVSQNSTTAPCFTKQHNSTMFHKTAQQHHVSQNSKNSTMFHKTAQQHHDIAKQQEENMWSRVNFAQFLQAESKTMQNCHPR
jgi:hypothetical protein